MSVGDTLVVAVLVGALLGVGSAAFAPTRALGPLIVLGVSLGVFGGAQAAPDTTWGHGSDLGVGDVLVGTAVVGGLAGLLAYALALVIVLLVRR